MPFAGFTKSHQVNACTMLDASAVLNPCGLCCMTMCLYVAAKQLAEPEANKQKHFNSVQSYSQDPAQCSRGYAASCKAQRP